MLSTLRECLAPAGLGRYGDTLLDLTEQELSSWPDSGEVRGGWLSLKGKRGALWGPPLLDLMERELNSWPDSGEVGGDLLSWVGCYGDTLLQLTEQDPGIPGSRGSWVQGLKAGR